MTDVHTGAARPDWTAIAFLSALAALPLAFEATMLVDAWTRDILAVDFEQTFRPAAERILDGESPYPAYGYPPLVAFLSVPFALLPAADVVLVLVLVAALGVSLHLLGVRDWRCYGAAFLWGPVFHGLQTANVTIPMLLGFSLAWRYRDRAYATALAAGATAALKFIGWPAGLWLLATRRVRAAAAATAIGLVLVFGPWATLGFSGLAGYGASTGDLAEEMAPESYTVSALLRDAGLPSLGVALALLLAAGALVGCIAYGRRGDDRRSLAYAAVLTILASPIVWLHSFVLLLLPLALLRPRLSWPWVAPALLWLASGNGNGAPWQTALTLAVAGAVFIAAVRPTRDSDRGLAAGSPARRSKRRLQSWASRAY